MEARSLSEDGLPQLYAEGADAAAVAPRAMLCELFVKEAYRRQGLGGDLCAACEDVVRDEWGMDELLLFVDERNDKAIALYRKLGYEWTSCARSTPSWLPEWLRKATADPVCMRKSLRGA